MAEGIRTSRLISSDVVCSFPLHALYFLVSKIPHRVCTVSDMSLAVERKHQRRTSPFHRQTCPIIWLQKRMGSLSY